MHILLQIRTMILTGQNTFVCKGGIQKSEFPLFFMMLVVLCSQVIYKHVSIKNKTNTLSLENSKCNST